MKDNIKAMNPSTQRDDFKTQWEHRQQWEKQAEKAQQDPAGLGAKVIRFHRNRRWIPYAAAASLVIGVTIFGMTRSSQPNDELPIAEEVTVESQTIHFVCNNGCSAQDIMLMANKVIK